MNNNIINFSRILILLSSSGISSAVERSLLSISQQRQSPSNLTLFGFTTFICDGIKLFSKTITSLSISYYALFYLIFIYSNIILIETQFELTKFISLILIQSNSWSLLAIFELISIIILISIQTSYVSLANNRNIEILIVTELVWSFLLIILIEMHFISRSSSLLYIINSIMLIMLLWTFFIIALEKVPFDIVEAESELIDGITTEYEGFIFSLIYAIESIIGFLLLKSLLYYSGFVIYMLFFYIILLYFGRSFLARFLIYDIIEMSLSIGLIISILLILIVNL